MEFKIKKISTINYQDHSYEITHYGFVSIYFHNGQVAACKVLWDQESPDIIIDISALVKVWGSLEKASQHFNKYQRQAYKILEENRDEILAMALSSNFLVEKL